MDANHALDVWVDVVKDAPVVVDVHQLVVMVVKTVVAAQGVRLAVETYATVVMDHVPVDVGQVALEAAVQDAPVDVKVHQEVVLAVLVVVMEIVMAATDAPVVAQDVLLDVLLDVRQTVLLDAKDHVRLNVPLHVPEPVLEPVMEMQEILCNFLLWRKIWKRFKSFTYQSRKKLFRISNAGIMSDQRNRMCLYYYFPSM